MDSEPERPRALPGVLPCAPRGGVSGARAAVARFAGARSAPRSLVEGARFCPGRGGGGRVG
eukprot:2423964-Lingulodinium_polyedra.AAC.1